VKVALLGTRGVPARYGGFETCVEEVGSRLAARGHDVIVYSRHLTSGDEDPRPTRYRGMRVVWLPAVRSQGLETLSHTAVSVAHLLRHHRDVAAAIMFNAANSPLLPALRAARVPVATHVDGLEWQRAKWGPTGRRYYRRAESLAVRWSDALIADAPGIEDYYRVEFAAQTRGIAYGAPTITADPGALASLDLTPQGFHLLVARFEPENHVAEIVTGYVASEARLPLVVVGAAPYAAEYTARVRSEADSRVRFLGSVWDQQLLDQLYANAATYLHGHSVGGTNPSLLRAIGAGAPAIAYDVVFNRGVLGEHGQYFHSAAELAQLIEAAEADPAATQARGECIRRIADDYNWDDVADRYEELCEQLLTLQFPTRRPSGRRVGTWGSQ
jgi:glycosyltransferase involved in cell wall biosynthesis